MCSKTIVYLILCCMYGICQQHAHTGYPAAPLGCGIAMLNSIGIIIVLQ